MYHFDLRSSLIPFSMLRIANTFGKMKIGEEIEIVSGISEIDRQTLKDIKRILSSDSYDIIEIRRAKDDGSVIVTRLRKKNLSTTRKGDSS